MHILIHLRCFEGTPYTAKSAKSVHGHSAPDESSSPSSSNDSKENQSPQNNENLYDLF